MPEESNFWEMTFRVIFILVSLFTIAAAALLAFVYRRLHAIGVPRDAGLFTTLRYVPIALPIALDLLDLAFDVFSAPVVWIVLSRFRMQALRNAATAVAVLPFTQVLPTFTTLWIAARVLKLGDPPPQYDRTPE
jgi:hypothetical protein